MVASSQSSILQSSGVRGARDRPPGRPAPRPLPLPPIGLVAFRTHRGEPAEAILDATGVWRCPVLPVLDRVLNALFRPDETVEPATSFGHAELGRVAAWIKGEVLGTRGSRVGQHRPG